MIATPHSTRLLEMQDAMIADLREENARLIRDASESRQSLLKVIETFTSFITPMLKTDYDKGVFAAIRVMVSK